jgi:hypothetical protein
MFQINSARFSGQSGQKYDFYVHPIDQLFKNVAAVYAVTRRYKTGQGGTRHDILYVGETGDLATTFANHHKWDCFVRQNANCICTHVDHDEASRLAKMDDLIRRHHPDCNN